MVIRVPSPTPAEVYAGFGRRTAATLIDSVLMLLITAPFPLLLVVLPSETAVLALSTLFSAVLVILFWRWKQGTPGKLMLRLRIVDADSGGEPSLRQWCLRYVGYVLSTVPLLLGSSGCCGIPAARPGTTSSPARWWSIPRDGISRPPRPRRRSGMLVLDLLPPVIGHDSSLP